MHILNSIESAQVLPYEKLVPALAVAVLELSSNKIVAPDRQVVPIDNSSVLLSMPAIGSDIGVTKLITVHLNNASQGFPAIQGEVIAFDRFTGNRLLMLDGPTVTARRTAAMSLLGIQTLLRSPPSAVTLIGTGVQAAAHADALVEYFGVTRFSIASRHIHNANVFCDTLQQKFPRVTATPIETSSLQRECENTQVVIALTNSTIPVIPENIPPHVLAIGVGAFKPEMAELPPELLHRRQVVLDDLDGAKHEAGDLIQAKIDWSKAARLSDMLLSEAPRSDVVPIFKTVGQAAWDLAAARVALASIERRSAS